MSRAALLLLGISLVMGLSGCASAPVKATLQPDGSQSAKIIVKDGYKPAEIVAEANKPLKVEFYRDEEHEKSCDSELVIPSENVKLHLPIRESQIVEIKAQPPGEVVFKCGMDMMHGKIAFK